MHIGIYIHFITHVGIYVVLKVHVAAGEVGRWLPRLPRRDSPEHMTSRVDSSEVEPTRSPVHEPQVDEP